MTPIDKEFLELFIRRRVSIRAIAAMYGVDPDGLRMLVNQHLPTLSNLLALCPPTRTSKHKEADTYPPFPYRPRPLPRQISRPR